ncbi:Preprotein translocase subunit SecE (TC 3.A.5.1.1) [Alloalcanivorax xenomutans]|nr:Preprotein translocase subunit SecE (TC 3.A.5.1.1) [Alloalcanivorax xenomutans]
MHRQMNEKVEGQSGSSALEVIKWLVVAALVAAAVFGNSYFSDVSPLYRALGVVAVALVAAFVALQTEQGKSFNQLRKDSMVELRKVVWPTRQETLQTTLIVLVFVVIVALLLFVLDWALNGLISTLIG